MTDADIPGFVKVVQESSTTSIFNFSDNVALGHSGRSVSSLCSGFLEVPLQHQHVSGEKVQFDEYTAGPTKAPVKKSPDNRVRKKTTIKKCKGVPVPMERIWAQLGFTASLCHH